MKIDKNIIKELSNYLDEFNLTEIEITEKDTKVGGDYTDDYARAKDKAENLNRKMNNPEYGYRKWVVVDIKGGK